MKKRLTLQFLFWNIIVLYIIQFLFFSLNILSVQRGFSFSKGFYNFAFSPNKICEKYKTSFEKSDDKFNLNADDLKVLTDNNIWIQILDNTNKEIKTINKPSEIPSEYLAGDLIKYAKSSSQMPTGSSIIARTFDKNNKKYSLIMGFPGNQTMSYTLGFTNESFKFYLALIVLGFILTIVAGYLFSRRLAKPVAGIIDDIKSLAKGDYNLKFKKKSGVYKEVNNNLNNLANTLIEVKKERENAMKQKEEWIANIAHDLKTPLASINGYAQLLKDEDYTVSEAEIIKYGEIISDKAAYIEDLISDLSLVYKFKNKVVPLQLHDENLVEVVRNIVIDILNNPLYEDREINIDYDEENIVFNCDKRYIKRALNNFLFNALVHNPKDTVIDINIYKKNGLILEIKDNGNGISKEDLKSLFDRYYRASNTGESHKGSGLGMAISKEIIEIHDGTIDVSSKLNEGTSIVICFN